MKDCIDHSRLIVMERGRTANVNVRHCEAEGDSDAAGECGKARWCETLTGLTTEGGNCAVCAT